MTKQVIKSGDNYQVTFGLCLKAIKTALRHAPLSYNVLDLSLLIIKITNMDSSKKLQAIKNHYSAVAAIKGNVNKGDSVFDAYNKALTTIETTNKAPKQQITKTKEVSFISKVKSFFKAA